MNEEMLFKQMKFVRNRTIAMIDATTEEIADKMPSGFRNNIRWNLGHILVIQESVIGGYLNEESSLPLSYHELFNRGTSPADWKDKDVPALSELRTALDEQYDRIVALCTGKVDQEGENPIIFGPEYQFTTLGEGINFANFHEAIHQGSINGLKRALGVEDLWEVK